MNGGLHELYQKAILDHNRNPRNYRVIEGARTAEGNNPVCGDRITIYVQMEGNVIRDVSFQGSGCAIMKASASLMTGSVRGLTLADTDALVERFLRMIATPPGGPVEDLGELTALAGVRWFPIRVKCARLPWHALRAATQARREVVSTE